MSQPGSTACPVKEDNDSPSESTTVPYVASSPDPETCRTGAMNQDTLSITTDPATASQHQSSFTDHRSPTAQDPSDTLLSSTTLSNDSLEQSEKGEYRSIKLIFVHGFTQVGLSWLRIAESMASAYEVMLIDAPGHGGSSNIRANLVDGAALLAKTAGQGVYIGYSMGGRFCLQLAINHANLVRALVLLGANPGIEDAEERKRRYAADLVLAEQLDPGEGKSNDSLENSSYDQQKRLDNFLKRWLEQPIFATLPVSEEDLALRRTNTPSGLASSLRLASTGAQQPLWKHLRELDMPVLVMAGERDEKFSAIGQRMVNLIGNNARFVSISGAGHAAHLEKPELFIDVLNRFLNELSLEPR
ncbi:MAG: alpha/beta fold hydrolase [Actinobacteria bacterium]|nr:alpha/beta fold hydrolase [Actinomycetota bacterium]